MRETGKDNDKKVFEITDVKNPVYAGQILAEMLAAICHPEHFHHCAQEVLLKGIMLTQGFCNIYKAHIFPTISLLIRTRTSS